MISYETYEKPLTSWQTVSQKSLFLTSFNGFYTKYFMPLGQAKCKMRQIQTTKVLVVNVWPDSGHISTLYRNVGGVLTKKTLGHFLVSPIMAITLHQLWYNYHPPLIGKHFYHFFKRLKQVVILNAQNRNVPEFRNCE